MEAFRTKYQVLGVLCVVLCAYSVSAHADISSANVLDRVQDRYAQIVTFWAATISARATWLFWTLALISMVWTFGMMALRKADTSEFFAEFIRFTMFVGFFWWLLDNGPRFAVGIINSMRAIGSDAANAGAAGAGLPASTANLPSPSGVMDIAFTMFDMVISKSSVWSPFSSAVGILLCIIILIVMALIALNMLILLICGWMLAYAGVFFLGFGGSKWTSDFAIAYFRTVLNIAAQLMAMVLIVGAGTSLIITIYGEMSADFRLKEMAVLMVASIVLLGLVNKVPGFIGGLASGGGTGALGSGYGAGAAVAAATMAGAAAATAGAAFASAAANIGGGTQALMAAFSKATQDAGGGSSARDFLAPPSGGGGNFANSSAALESTSFGRAVGGASSHSAEIAQALAEKSAGAAGESSKAGGDGSSPAASTSDSATQASSKDQGSAPSTASQPSEDSSVPKKGGGGDATRSARNSEGSGLAKAAGKAGRIAAGTVANLGIGAFDVGMKGAGNMIGNARQRISETIGGKMATAIKARRDSAVKSSSSPAAAMQTNSISASNETVDRAAEVAAFRDGKHGPDGDNT